MTIIKIIMAIILLTGCSASSSSPGKLGHWIDTYPSEFSVWQCVESFSPFKNKEC